MTTPEELQALLTRAMDDRQQEPAFFRALLDATVYAHVPLSDQNTRLRFMQFRRPDDGLTVLPFFTDEATARWAAQSAARVVVMTGRQLMEATRGATLVLNPTARHCTLYPEEIKELLATGTTAVIETVHVEEEAAPLVMRPETTPAWLVDTVTAILVELPFISVAYLAGRRLTEAASESGLLIALGGEPRQEERAARAITAAVQSLCRHHHQEVDLVHFNDAEAFPAWLANLELEPFYQRTWGSRLQQADDPTPRH